MPTVLLQKNYMTARTLSIMFRFFLTAKYNYSLAERLLQEIFQATSPNTKDIAIWFHTCSSNMDGLTTSQPLLTGMDSLPPTNRVFSKESLYLNFARNSYAHRQNSSSAREPLRRPLPSL
jgi:hypothetical protein